MKSSKWVVRSAVAPSDLKTSVWRFVGDGVVSDFRARAGDVFLISGEGHCHSAANQYLRSPRMRSASKLTRDRYSRSLAVWFSFLSELDVEWNHASIGELADFKYWRRSDPTNSRRIAGSSWNSDLAAIQSFYGWCAARGSFAVASDETTAIHLIESRTARASASRNADVRWLSPAAFDQWADRGILGIREDGSELANWRPRNEARDYAFVTGLYGSGLRLNEWASVLTVELDCPATHSSGFRRYMLADACAKAGAGHWYWLPQRAHDALQNYRDHERRKSVARAHKSGLYSRSGWEVVLFDSSRPSVVRFAENPRKAVKLRDLPPSRRRRLLTQGPGGLEPANVWLNEDGSTREKRAWYRSFGEANQRVRRAGVERLVCHPHMLRHSFALRWYAASRLAGGSLGDFRDTIGDVWFLVQTMLGHRSVETTRRIYLEPFVQLDVENLLAHTPTGDGLESFIRQFSSVPQLRLAD